MVRAFPRVRRCYAFAWTAALIRIVGPGSWERPTAGPSRYSVVHSLVLCIARLVEQREWLLLRSLLTDRSE